MEIPPQVLQFAVSLLAIFALTGLAMWLGLGGTPKLEAEADLERATSQVADGFEVKSYALDRSGIAAIAEDEDNQVMIIKRHGNRFAGRILDRRAGAKVDGDILSIDSGERHFGTVQLQSPQASTWAERIDRLKE